MVYSLRLWMARHLNLRQIELAATSPGEGPIAIRGGLRSGAGNLSIVGTAASGPTRLASSVRA